MIALALLLIFFCLPAPALEAASRRVMAHYLPWFQSKDDPYISTWGATWSANGHTPDAVDPLTGRRDISAKDYPLIGPYDSNDPKSLEYHILLAQSSGISGFIVDYFGTNSDAGVRLIKQGFEALATNALYLNRLNTAGLYSNFKVCLAYDEQALGFYGSAYSTHASNDLVFIQNAYAGRSFYATNAGTGKPLLFIWPYFSHLSYTEWQTLLNRFTNFFAVDFKEYPSDHNFASHYPWVNGFTTDGSGWGSSYLDGFYAGMATNSFARFATGGVWPGFDDSGWRSTNVRIMNRQGLDVYKNTWAKITAYAGTPLLDLVQVITWNDWGEGTEIEPSLEYSYQFVKETREQANAYMGQGFTDDRALLLPQIIYNARLAVNQGIAPQANLILITNAIRDFYQGNDYSGLTNATKAMNTFVPALFFLERGNGTLEAKWNKIASCQGYKVYVTASSNYLSMGSGVTVRILSNAGITNTVITGLDNGKDYFCAVSSWVGRKNNESRYLIEGWVSDLRRSKGDSTRPAPVEDFRAEMRDGRIRLSWKTPSAADYHATCIVYLGAGRYPETPEEGVEVVRITNQPGTETEHYVLPGPSGRRYFSAFSLDRVENYGIPAHAALAFSDRMLKVAGNYIVPSRGWTAAFIYLDLAEPGKKVRIRVMNLKGGIIKDFGEKALSAGRNRFVWPERAEDLKNIPSGVYIISVTGDIEAAEKIVVVK